MPYFDTEDQSYGCFRCGEVNGEISINDDTGIQVCNSCGEPGIVTFRTALDMLNAYYLSNRLQRDFDADQDYLLDGEELN